MPVRLAQRQCDVIDVQRPVPVMVPGWSSLGIPVTDVYPQPGLVLVRPAPGVVYLRAKSGCRAVPVAAQQATASSAMMSAMMSSLWSPMRRPISAPSGSDNYGP